MNKVWRLDLGVGTRMVPFSLTGKTRKDDGYFEIPNKDYKA
jgi:hypothetical protein